MPGAVRREIELRGVVQGVGFRPWAARLARAFDLAGEVQNAAWGVRVALEGRRDAVSQWLARLHAHPPTGARIDAIEVREVPCTGQAGFAIAASAATPGDAPTRIPPDRAICSECVTELFDPLQRRYRYPFTHCACCGPRASILLGIPFDRERTTLRAFALCETCAREYVDPEDRRFHAESIACPACGPQLGAYDTAGTPISGDPIEAAAACIRGGGIVALKSYGGFHLVCDAAQTEAISRLRKRKARPAKPLAVMVPDLARARALITLRPADATWLDGPAHAVLVAPRRDHGDDVSPAVAPRTRELGLILPIAPLHWLLLYGPQTRPGTDAPRFGALVLTSANLCGEPTQYDDANARERLAGLADLVVTHDRAVARPNDDPVVRSAPGAPIPIRLSRSTAPLCLRVADADPTKPVTLAVGGDLKAAPAVLVRGEVVLGEHIGDLASVDAADALECRALALCRMLEARPTIVAHDLHPDYVGTQLAARLARALGARSVGVQHHHAHAVACLAEHGHRGAALALVLDGAGWGHDGTIWGGELLRVDGAHAQRLAHLECVRQPGGDAAVREPWRMAWAWLRQAFPSDSAPRLPWHERRDAAALERIARAADRDVASPWTSSCGRLFDAVACLLDLGDRANHEGELATALEALAESAEANPPPTVREAGPAPGGDIIRVSPLVRDLVHSRARGASRGALAWRFHATLAERLVAASRVAAQATGLRDIVLSGGCLQNRLLQSELVTRLADLGFRVLVHRQTPPNDGGLAVGQAVVASERNRGQLLLQPGSSKPTERGSRGICSPRERP